MFFKHLEFIIFKKFYINWLNFSNNKFLTFTAHFITLILCWYCLVISTGVFLRTLLFSLSFFFITYWLISIFIYLFKKSRFGTFTRIIQRFWKRSLYLFWMLEVGLFCIYLFLITISPQEVMYMLDNSNLFYCYNNNLKAFFETLQKPILIILLANLTILTLKVNAWRLPIIISITILLLLSLFDDFVQFYVINQQYINYTWTYNSVENDLISFNRTKSAGLWEQEISELKLRPYIHYLYLLVFLKLWHTLFIVYVFLMLENIRLHLQHSSFNILSANIQNFYFLLFFNFILKISFIKNYLNYLVTFVYFWFYTNYNLYDYYYFYHLFQIKYIFYVIYDIYSFC